MTEESEIIYIDGLGRMLGRTDAAIRQGLSRGVDWLPKGFKMGIKHCWLKDDVLEFLRGCRDGENKPVKVGRKRSQPPTLRGVA